MAKKEVIPTTKSQMFSAIAAAAGITKKQFEDAYAEFLRIAYAGAKLEKGIVLPGLGKLLVKKQAARKVRNPQTGAEIKKPACKVAKFRLAKAAKDGALAK